MKMDCSRQSLGTSKPGSRRSHPTACDPMHELSIAVSLIEAASEKAAAVGAKQVYALHLKIGALSGVVRDALLFSFDIATVGTSLEGATLHLEDVPVVVFCPACREEKTLTDYYGFACPDCGTLAPEVRRGRELELTAIEVENNDVESGFS
jgi:hydrogenase nickel incorporation protein HypA/HybF